MNSRRLTMSCSESGHRVAVANGRPRGPGRLARRSARQ